MSMQIDRMAIDKQDTFDHDMQQLHAASVSHLSPQTLARLRAARHGLAEAAPQRGHSWRWITASAFSAVLAVVIGVQFLPHSQTLPDGPLVASTTNVDEDTYVGSTAALDENPDLYVWLASQDAATLAME